MIVRIGIIIFIIGVVFLSISIFICFKNIIKNNNGIEIIKEINCYDKFNNKIKGVICESKEVVFDDKTNKEINIMIYCAYIGIVLLFIGAVIKGLE